MKNTPPVERRSQSERRATSARRIIKATIRCLNRYGYGGATIDAVLIEANVSRGRLLHHFPTRADLMIAVSRYVWELDSRFMRRWAQRYPDPRDRLANSVDLAWQMMSRSTGMAVLEILVACRSDPSLSERFIPEHVEVQAEADRSVIGILAELGLEEKVDGRALHHYVEACVRGLAIDRAFTENGDGLPPPLQFLREQVAKLMS